MLESSHAKQMDVDGWDNAVASNLEYKSGIYDVVDTLPFNSGWQVFPSWNSLRISPDDGFRRHGWRRKIQLIFLWLRVTD